MCFLHPSPANTHQINIVCSLVFFSEMEAAGESVDDPASEMDISLPLSSLDCSGGSEPGLEEILLGNTVLGNT